MSIPLYIPTNSKIVHFTSVDFADRNIVNRPIKMVQYDKKIPVVAARLHVGGKPYSLSTDSEVRLRWSRKDKKFVYKNVLGCNADGNIIYFDIGLEMSYLQGTYEPIIEIIVPIDDGFGRVGSSPITVIIDRNPIQDGDIESQLEYSPLLDLYEQIQSSMTNIYSKEHIDQIFETKINADERYNTLDNSKVSKSLKIIDIDLSNDITLEEFKNALGEATKTSSGLMSPDDKRKIDLETFRFYMGSTPPSANADVWLDVKPLLGEPVTTTKNKEVVTVNLTNGWKNTKKEK